MIGFVMVGTNDLQASSKFYDVVLAPLGLIKVETSETYVGYAQKNNQEKVEFYITKPFNKEKATYGNGTQVSFLTDSKASVDSFHVIALKNGNYAIQPNNRILWHVGNFTTKNEWPDYKTQTSEWNVETKDWSTDDTDRMFYDIIKKDD